MSDRDYLTEREAAELIGMSVSFLRAARSRGVLGNRTPPPPHLQMGRAIRYSRRALDEWMSARRVDPAARHKSRGAEATA